MKTHFYKPLLLAAAIVLFGLVACEKEHQDFGDEQGAKSENSVIYKTQPANGAPVTFGFWAGRHINAGNLLVSNDEQNLYITFKTTGNWWLQLTHLHIATTLGGVPNRNGTPVPGHFQYKTTHNPRVQTFTYTIPKTWAEGQNLVIAAHAEVVLLDANGRVIQSETAFGGDTPGPGKRWWFWASYTVGSGSSVPDPGTGPGGEFVFKYCANAWAIDTLGSSYINGVLVDGVFFRKVDETAQIKVPMIAANNEGKQITVGHITINNVTPLSEAYIEIKVKPEYALTEVRLYLENNSPTSLVLNNFHEFLFSTPQPEFRIFLNNQKFNSVDFDSGIFFVAANAKFCPSTNQRLSSR